MSLPRLSPSNLPIVVAMDPSYSSHPHTELIDRYLCGQLDHTERAAFQQRCEDDPSFAAEVKRQVIAEATARRAAREQRVAHFNAIYDQSAASASRGIVRQMWPYAVAVAAALALLLLLLWPQPQTPQSLYLAYQPSPQPASFYKGERTGSDLILALEAYNQADYQTAIDHLQQQLSDSVVQRPNTLHYYLGLSYLFAFDQAAEADRSPDASYLPQAIRAFQRVEIGSAFGQQAQWQLALTYLRANRSEEARQVLRSIAEQQGHFKQATAQEMLAHWPLTAPAPEQ